MTNEVVLITGDTLGSPDEKLGAILMSSFLRLLGQRETMPEFIILLNAGIKLATKGAETVEFLEILEEKGVKIISCRTCVEYFDLEAETAVGMIDGMVRIQNELMTHPVLTI